MKAIELKFILKLLGFEEYRAPITELNPGENTSASERDGICRYWANREIVNYSYKIQQFKIEPPGQALLNQDEAQYLLSPEQLFILKACSEKSIKPGDLGKKVPVAERQSIIQDLAAKGLVKSTKNVQIKEVWLTERGKEYLKEEFIPSEGKNPAVSFNLLRNYIEFLRKVFRTNSKQINPPDLKQETNRQEFLAKPSDDEVLQTIKELDRQLGTNNYLPIFHLRQKLQPPLSRDELDQILYRLQREDKLEMNSLIEGMRYPEEQIQAGIAQDSSSPLFFLEVIDS